MNQEEIGQNRTTRIQRMLEPNLDSPTLQPNLTKKMNSK